MIRLIGVLISCTVTGYVFFGVMNTLYEKKYQNNNLPYIGAFILYIFLGSIVIKVRLPAFNVIYSMVILCFLSFSLFKPKQKNVIINSAIIIIYLILVDFLVTTIFSTISSNSTYIALQDAEFFLISGVGNALVMLCTWNLLVQLIMQCEINKVTKSLYFYMLFLMVFEFGILCYLLKINSEMGHNIPLLVICFGFIIMDGGILYLFKIYSKTAALEKQADLLEQQQKITVKYYTSLLESYNETQKILHDMKRHLNVIAELDGKLEEEYKEELLEMIDSVQPNFQCTDKIICAIMWDKIQVCKRENIILDIHMQDIEFNFMNKTEITTLFANLLDNAIEACQSSKVERKEISLRIHRFKNYIVIKMRNTIGREPIIKAGILKSTKPDHLGMGMVLLDNLANKYCGNLNFDKMEDFFETKIILSINNEL